MHSWLGHKSITGTAVHTALAANRFKDRTSQGAQARPCIGLSGVVLIVARGRVYDVTTTSTDIPAKASDIPTKVPDTGLAC
jgi:hypothetical protein